jgi:hypothetical protein
MFDHGAHVLYHSGPHVGKNRVRRILAKRHQTGKTLAVLTGFRSKSFHFGRIGLLRSNFNHGMCGAQRSGLLMSRLLASNQF